MASAKPRLDREELAPPPYLWISWLDLAMYLGVFAEAIILTVRLLLFPAHDDRAIVFGALQHLIIVYIFEVVLALSLGWCAMSPGWTLKELAEHHVPFIVGVSFLFLYGRPEAWQPAMRVVLFTALNEALFIAKGLGAPEWMSTVRRRFAFGIVALLLLVETGCLLRASVEFAAAGEVLEVLIAQLVWAAVAYHVILLRMYIRRFRKHGTI
mmetsp:Transcript_91842/g.163467  ORF Transcript_91842/g.163467 Transcript_91842/m.163467 type:complete len:211 (-) Transcript_91842:173-805(-)